MFSVADCCQARDQWKGTNGQSTDAKDRLPPLFPTCPANGENLPLETDKSTTSPATFAVPLSVLWEQLSTSVKAVRSNQQFWWNEPELPPPQRPDLQGQGWKEELQDQLQEQLNEPEPEDCSLADEASTTDDASLPSPSSRGADVSTHQDASYPFTGAWTKGFFDEKISADVLVHPIERLTTQQGQTHPWWQNTESPRECFSMGKSKDGSSQCNGAWTNGFFDEKIAAGMKKRVSFGTYTETRLEDFRIQKSILVTKRKSI